MTEEVSSPQRGTNSVSEQVRSKSESDSKEEIEEKETKPEQEESGKKEQKQKSEKKKERVGIAYIFSSSNNTIVHITDLAGNTISRVSGGMVTKHSRLKSNPTIAMFVAKRAAERASDLGFTSIYVRTKAKTGSPGLGPGCHSAVKSLDKSGLKILNVLDTTRTPRGGPKKKGGKRGRRV